MLKPWLKSVIEGMITSPEELTIEEKTDELGILFTVKTLNTKDCGLLIGRSGEHINALRVILRTAGHLNGVKASIKIVSE